MTDQKENYFLPLEPNEVDILGKKSTMWLQELCTPRKALPKDESISEKVGNSLIFRTKWTVYWGDKTLETTGPPASQIKTSKHLASTQMLREMGVTRYFLETHSSAGLKQLPIWTDGYVPPSQNKENIGLANPVSSPEPVKLVSGTTPENNSVLKLRELCSDCDFGSPVIESDVARQTGPSNCPTFTFVCRVDPGKGREVYKVEVTKTGSNKIEMKRLAADKMINYIKERHGDNINNGNIQSSKPTEKEEVTLKPEKPQQTLSADEQILLNDLNEKLKITEAPTVLSCTLPNCWELLSHKHHLYKKMFHTSLLEDIRREMTAGEVEADAAPHLLEKVVEDVPNCSVDYSEVPMEPGVVCIIIELTFQGDFCTLHGVGSSMSEARNMAAFEMIKYLLELTN